MDVYSWLLGAMGVAIVAMIVISVALLVETVIEAIWRDVTGRDWEEW